MDNQPQNQPHKTAFVLGNGRSRLCLKLNELRHYGKIYGCNALYREFNPDFLIAVDEKMVREIEANGYQLKHPVWTNPNKGVLKVPGLNFFNPHKGLSSGPTALWLANEHGYDQIFIFGFDYQGLEGRVNNVYADTQNYKRSIDSATYYGNWLNQTDQVIKKNKKTTFIRVIEDNDFIPQNLSQHTVNFRHMTYKEFNKEYPGTIFR
jgi:hypothetical protein